MAHFAELNESNIVTQVIVVANAELMDGGAESEAKGIAFLESLYGHRNWRQTSYNGNIRYNYAGIGFAYDPDRDAFISPQPFASWTLNETTCQWQPPVPHPDDGGMYSWDEAAGNWVSIA